MPFADFGSSIFDTFDGIGNVLLGQTRVHRDVEAAFVEVSAGFRALIREISSLCEESVKTLPDAPAGTRIARLVSEHSAFYMDLLSPANTVHATLFYKHFHKFLRTGTGSITLPFDVCETKLFRIEAR